MEQYTKRFNFFPGTLGLLTITASQLVQGQPAEKPNVIIIYADELGYGEVSCYGTASFKTPNIDRLADCGLHSTNAFITSVTYKPSHHSLLTGEYTWRRSGTGILPGDTSAIIQPGRTTLASTMKAACYCTGVEGKWHLGLSPGGGPGWNGEIRNGPLDIGFGYCSINLATINDTVPQLCNLKNDIGERTNASSENQAGVNE